MKAEYEDVLRYTLHTDLLLGRMLAVIIQLIAATLAFLVALTAGFELGTGTSLLIPSPNISKPHLAVIFVGVSSLLVAGSIAWLVSILRMAMKYVSLFFNVSYFKSYVKSIPDDLRDKNVEELVECAARERAIPYSTAMTYRPVGTESKISTELNTDTPSLST